MCCTTALVQTAAPKFCELYGGKLPKTNFGWQVLSACLHVPLHTFKETQKFTARTAHFERNASGAIQDTDCSISGPPMIGIVPHSVQIALQMNDLQAGYRRFLTTSMLW
jgi:hypothetical protein